MQTVAADSSRLRTFRAALLPCLLAVFTGLPIAAQAQAVVAAALPPGAAASAPSASEVFRRLGSDNWVSRVVSLADLGIREPLVLGYPETTREIALPVPPNVQLANATLQVDASFVRADGCRTTLILSLDGLPTSARPVTAERGDGSLTLAVDGAPRSSGIVKFNIDWRTAIARENTCSDTRTPGNLLRIEPTSRFSYRFDGTAVRDLPSAWAALPLSPLVMVAGSKLSADAYDSAWRLGVALERGGKRPRIASLPEVGDTVDLSGVVVPTALRRIPAFAALAEGGKHKIKDLAEVGALMTLGPSGPLHPDLVVADRATGSVLARALDELRAQLPAEAVEAFTAWREKALDGWGRQLASGQVRLTNVFGRPAIVVAPDAGKQAAGMFTQSWQHWGAAQALLINAADDPKTDIAAVSLKYLGAKPGTLEVLNKADWTAGFDLAAVASERRGPASLVIDVAAAPGAARTAPVVSVFLNDVLLGAREMEANGRRERIVAPIPRHALSTRNAIRVSFVRQQASDRCRETPEAYPVSVLATSHIVLDKLDSGPDFSGLISRFADGANVLVPIGYLYDAPASLPRVIALAASTGVSPSQARFFAVSDVGPPKLKGPFLSIDVALKDVQDSDVKVEGGRLYLAAGSDRPLLDVGGLGRAGLLEVTRMGRDEGAIYRTIGRDAPPIGAAMQLSRGNIAVISANGLRAEINTTDPFGQAMVRDALPARGEAVWHQHWPAWALALLGVTALAGLGYGVYRRRIAKRGA